MKHLLPILSVTLATAFAPAGAWAGQAVVTFANTGDFTDFPDRNNDGEELLKALSEHFIKQAAKLPATQELKIEVLDIDLAGTIKPNFRSPRDIRVVKGRTDGPIITVRFTLSENGQVLKSGEEQLRDIAFLQRSNRYYTDDPLRYEKKMVDDWMQERFGLSL